jgi:hypothetical protein
VRLEVVRIYPLVRFDNHHISRHYDGRIQAHASGTHRALSAIYVVHIRFECGSSADDKLLVIWLSQEPHFDNMLCYVSLPCSSGQFDLSQD